MPKLVELDKIKVTPLAMAVFNGVALQVAEAGYDHFILIKNGGSIEVDKISLMGAEISKRDIQEKIGKDSGLIMFESGVRQFQSHAGAASLSGGLSHPAIAFQTKEARDIVLDMILESSSFHRSVPATVLFADFVDGEVRVPLDNVTQWSAGKDKQQKYVVL